jgi:hypothetical protein
MPSSSHIQEQAGVANQPSTKDAETASVSTFASDQVLAEKAQRKPSSSKNGTNFSEKDLKDKLLKSQIRFV